MSNLRLINETSFSATANVNVTDVFSADFDIYKITVETTSTTNNYLPTIRFLNTSGSLVSASNYDEAHLELKWNTAFTELRATNTSRIRIAGNGGNSAGQGTVSTVYIFNPYSSSSYSFLLEQSFVDITGSQAGQKGIGVLKQTASMGGFQIFDQNYGANLTGVTRTYGLRVDS